MTATAHALVGGAIAASVTNPALGITLSAASHPLLDMIPHWDEGLGWRKKSKTRLFIESSIDLVFGVTVTFLIFGPFTPFWYLAACIFVSEIWDILMMPYLVLRWNFFPFSTVYKIQHKMQSNIRLPWGILTQIATVLVIILVLQTIPRT